MSEIRAITIDKLNEAEELNNDDNMIVADGSVAKRISFGNLKAIMQTNTINQDTQNANTFDISNQTYMKETVKDLEGTSIANTSYFTSQYDSAGEKMYVTFNVKTTSALQGDIAYGIEIKTANSKNQWLPIQEDVLGRTANSVGTCSISIIADIGVSVRGVVKQLFADGVDCTMAAGTMRGELHITSLKSTEFSDKVFQEKIFLVSTETTNPSQWRYESEPIDFENTNDTGFSLSFKKFGAFGSASDGARVLMILCKKQTESNWKKLTPYIYGPQTNLDQQIARVFFKAGDKVSIKLTSNSPSKSGSPIGVLITKTNDDFYDNSNKKSYANAKAIFEDESLSDDMLVMKFNNNAKGLLGIVSPITNLSSYVAIQSESYYGSTVYLDNLSEGTLNNEAVEGLLLPKETENTVDISCYGYSGKLARSNGIIDSTYVLTATRNNQLVAYQNSLTYAKVPRNVSIDGSWRVFSQCSALTNVDISAASLLSVQQVTFENCRSLNSIVLPQSVESIGKNAFISCINLKDIYIPINAFKETANGVLSTLLSATTGSKATLNIVLPNSKESYISDDSSIKTILASTINSILGSNSYIKSRIDLATQLNKNNYIEKLVGIYFTSSTGLEQALDGSSPIYINISNSGDIMS